MNLVGKLVNNGQDQAVLDVIVNKEATRVMGIVYHILLNGHPCL